MMKMYPSLSRIIIVINAMNPIMNATYLEVEMVLSPIKAYANFYYKILSILTMSVNPVYD